MPLPPLGLNKTATLLLFDNWFHLFSAIEAVLEMKSKGFKPAKALLVLIKGGFFEFSVDNMDRYATICMFFGTLYLLPIQATKLGQ